MSDKTRTSSGTWILLFVSLFNLVALVCLTAYQLRFNKDIEEINIHHHKCVLKEIISDLKQHLSPRTKRSSVASNIVDPELTEIIQELTSIQRSLAQKCSASCRAEAIDVVKEAVTFLRPSDSHVRRQVTGNGSSTGNEMVQIFKEMAKSEIDIINKYCSNSTLCLPGAKGDKGDVGMMGLPGKKGDPGVSAPGRPGTKGEKGDTGMAGNTGPQGLKGEPGMMGLPGMKGEMGISVPGPTGAKGDTGAMGNKGDPGIQGIKGDKGDVGPMGVAGGAGPQGKSGLKGDKGDTGLQGQTGNPGPQGSQGEKGNKGDTGIQGVAGYNGTMGSKGQKGEPGLRAPPYQPQTTCCQSLAVPLFGQQIEQIRVIEGTDVTMRCDPVGFPPPLLSWNPNPNSLDHFRTIIGPQNLTIQNTKVGDSKLYTCAARNALGDSEKQFMVQVYKHIKFSETPQNHTVMMGSPVVLECKIDGPLHPTVTWYKIRPDGSRLQLNTDITPIANGSQFHIDHVTRADEGQYTCEGHNGLESINKSAFIGIIGPPHIQPPGVVTAIKGDQVVLKCVANAHPPATFTWSYPPGVSNAYVDNDGSLVILNVNPKDATNYQCHAHNRYGTDQATVTLHVQVPPKITLTPPTTKVVPGVTNIAIECRATGDQPLTVTWTKDGKPISSNGHVFILPGNVLLVNQATTSDYGAYKCTASNAHGTTHATSYAYDDQGTISCATVFNTCKQTACGAMCPPNCDSDPQPVFGLTEYTTDSGICKAAIQVGTVMSSGGHVTWFTTNNVTSFVAGTNHGITSSAKPAGNGSVAAVFVV